MLVVKYQTMNTKNDSYWSALADDIRFFRKGVISLEEMKNKYPDLDIGKGYSHWYNYEEAMYIVIPRECPLSDALELVCSTDHELKDQNAVEIRGGIFPYQTEWEQLPEIGELEKSAKKGTFLLTKGQNYSNITQEGHGPFCVACTHRVNTATYRNLFFNFY